MDLEELQLIPHGEVRKIEQNMGMPNDAARPSAHVLGLGVMHEKTKVSVRDTPGVRKSGIVAGWMRLGLQLIRFAGLGPSPCHSPF